MKSTNYILLSPVIMVKGDYNKIGECVLGDIERATLANDVLKFDEQYGVTVNVKEVVKMPTFDRNIRRYQIFKAVDGVVQVRNVPFIGEAFIALKSIDTQSASLEWNPLFRYWSSLPVTKVGKIGQHLETIVSVQLLKRGLTLMHGAAVSSHNSAILFTGLPNQGKTSTVVDLLERGYYFLSEDVAVISQEGRVFSVPFTTSLKELSSRTILRKNQKKTILDVLPQCKITADSSLDMIVILNRSQENRIIRLPQDEALKKILLINHLEFFYSRNILLRTYLALHSLEPVSALMTIEGEIIKKCLERAEVYLLSFKTHSDRKRLLEEILA